MGKSTGEKRTRRIVNLRSGGEEHFGLCERCGSHGGALGTSVHHRKNRSQGGAWSPENCVVLCGSGTTGCHGWVTVNPLAARAEGFVVRSFEDEALVQCRTFSGWVFLGDRYVPLEEQWDRQSDELRAPGRMGRMLAAWDQHNKQQRRGEAS